MKPNKFIVVILAAASAFAALGDYPYIPYTQKMLGSEILVENLAFSSVRGALDGPRLQAMIHRMWGANSDNAGNVYVYDHVANGVRVIRKSDGRIFTITGNQRCLYGETTQPSGPARRLRFGTDDNIGATYHYFAAIGDNPLEGNGSVYVSDPNTHIIVRLYRNNAEGNAWWYEVVAGQGTSAVGDGKVTTTCKLGIPIVCATPDGRVGCSPGEYNAAPAQFYWIEDGKFKAAYDFTLLTGVYSAKSRAYSVDAAGRILIGGVYGTPETFFVTVAADGRSFTRDSLPYPTQWTLYPDTKRPDYAFYRATDDYSINVYNRKTKTTGAITISGGYVYKPKANVLPDSALGWMRGVSMADGRYVGWNNHGGNLFAMTFLDSGALSVSGGNHSPLAGTRVDCSPNPFSGLLAVKFSLASASRVRLTVYDIQGRLVRSFPESRLSAGTYASVWDGRNNLGNTAAPGRYVCCLRMNKETITKMVALRE